MEWKAVDSSQIAEVGHDPETETLGIRFKATKKNPITEYHYSFVSDDVFQALLTAESVGKYFTEHIKQRPDLYPYQKIENVEA